MRTLVITNAMLLFQTLFRLAHCHQDLKTIHFLYQEISEEQKYQYLSLRDLPFPEYRSKGLPFYLVATILATKLNVSNVITKNWYSKDTYRKFFSDINQYQKTDEVTIFVPASTFGKQVHSTYSQWKRFQSFAHKPIYVNVQNLEWNFVYCDLPRWKKDPLWNLSVLTSVFDLATWVGIAITILTTAVTLGPKQFHTNLMLLISSMLSGGLSGTIKSQKALIVIWLLLIRILVDIYSGGVSSRLISPPEELSLKSFGDLDRNNYSAAVSDDRAASSAIQFINSLASNKTGTWVNNGFVDLKTIFSRQIVASANYYDQVEIALFLKRNYSSKVSYSSIWILPMLVMNIIEDMQDNGVKEFENGAMCHLGKETLNGGAMFWMFLPPNNELIARYFQLLVESGIFFRLQDEHRGFSYSYRVQGRNRFISKTQMKTGRYADGMKRALNQQMQGKMLKVFFLYALCILASIIGMLIELIFGFTKKTTVVNLR